MLARPGVERGRHVPQPHLAKEILKDEEANEKQRKEVGQWIKQDQAKNAK